MKIKTDENIGGSGVDILRQNGHDVTSVREQGLGGASDEHIFHVCNNEQRALITLDRDFGHVLRFPPSQSAGLAILELGGARVVAAFARSLARFSFRRVEPVDRRGAMDCRARTRAGSA